MNTNQLQILFITIAAAITSVFIFILVRKNNKRIEMGELQNTDVIGVLETWDSKSNDVIARLHPKIRVRVSQFVDDLTKQNIKYRLYSGFRSFDEQGALYGKGRTTAELGMSGVDTKYAKPGENRVTNAKPGSSYHNYGLAFDGVEIVGGNAIWKSTQEQKIVDTAKKYGFAWGGNFTSFKDTPHFEDTQYGTVNQLLALYNNNQLSNGYLIV